MDKKLPTIKTLMETVNGLILNINQLAKVVRDLDDRLEELETQLKAANESSNPTKP